MYLSTLFVAREILFIRILKYQEILKHRGYLASTTSITHIFRLIRFVHFQLLSLEIFLSNHKVNQKIET